MGKGNFILGTGSSSIGDVTFARRNGQQIARVRVRKIKNPKSYGQAEQRMISAEVVKFYSPLSGVLETSFEGLSKSESYAKFLSVNMNIARANGYGVAKGSQWVGMPLQVSSGSLQQANVLNDDADRECCLVIDNVTPAGEQATWGEISAGLIAQYGLQNGDQVTFIYHTDMYKNTPKYMRVFVDSASAEAPANLRFADGGLKPADTNVIGLAVVFSRWNGETWARSTAMYVMRDSEVTALTQDYETKVATYMKAGGRTPVSDVYLNGQDDE